MKHATTLALIASCGAAIAGTTQTIITESDELPPASNAWEFRVTPYGWLTALSGTTGPAGYTTEIDDSFGDILKNLKMYAAFQVEARNQRWGIIADGFYADLGTSGSPPGPLYNRASVDMKQFIGELSLAYRVYQSPQGFVDLYAGLRYNDLSMEFASDLNLPGIQSVSDTTVQRITTGIDQRAQAIVQPKAASFKTGSAARRAAIESQITAAIEAEAETRVKQDLKKQLLEIHRNGTNLRTIERNRISRAVKSQRLRLARSTANLEVAKLRASVDASLRNKVAQAEARVQSAEQELSNALNNQLQQRLPTNASADKSWTDPIIGARAQWNIDDKWFLAGKGDVGGFGVGSDFAWNLQATVGYQFTETISAELGYRYYQTDYSDSGFVYDMAQSGLYTGLNFTF